MTGRPRHGGAASALFVIMLSACASPVSPDEIGAKESEATGLSLSWFDSGLSHVRRRLGEAADAVGGAATRTGQHLSSRIAVANKRCAGQAEEADCQRTAQLVCEARGFRGGQAVETSSEQACRGLSLVTPDGAQQCKTKHRLRTALCW